MVYETIEQRLNKLRRLQQKQIGKHNYKGTKKTRRLQLLEQYCKDQKGYCMVCGETMSKPVFKINDENLTLGACCGKMECRASEDYGLFKP